MKTVQVTVFYSKSFDLEVKDTKTTTIAKALEAIKLATPKGLDVDSIVVVDEEDGDRELYRR